MSHAKHLADRAGTKGYDFATMLETLCQRVITAEREGAPGVLLNEIDEPECDEELNVHGLALLRLHPNIIFGDGAVGKSLFGLWLLGELAKQGLRVALVDWELDEGAHRRRLGKLFSESMPRIRYVRCDKPLTYEVDRLGRIVRDDDLDFVMFDSIGFATDGPAEAHEVASRYSQAVRRLGAIGTLHTAHTAKAEGSDRKPFGSVYWFNFARACWNIKLAESAPDGKQINIGLYHRKANLGAIRPAVGFEITFAPERTIFRPVPIEDVPDLSAHLSVRHRMTCLLRHGSMSPEVVAEEIDANVETVKRTARRYRKQFTVLKGGNVALREQRA